MQSKVSQYTYLFKVKSCIIEPVLYLIINPHSKQIFNNHRLEPCVLKLIKTFRLYIKHHCRHPLVTQSVAIVNSTDGLEIDLRSLTVFTSIASLNLKPIPLSRYSDTSKPNLYKTIYDCTSIWTLLDMILFFVLFFICFLFCFLLLL